mmetsp:Transcript_29531/g.61535  ORF Transcript_29531/g.61535 Transcript_29531/m.61535 type:complete len:100 (-) Transcript_29531:2493-2792(-)
MIMTLASTIRWPKKKRMITKNTKWTKNPRKKRKNFARKGSHPADEAGVHLLGNLLLVEAADTTTMKKIILHNADQVKEAARGGVELALLEGDEVVEEIE